MSTDDQEIAKTAREEGAEVPFIRPPDLSGNRIGVMPVVIPAILQLHRSGIMVSNLCLIYATAPLLKVDALRKGWQVLQAENSDYAVAVMRTANCRLTMFQPEQFCIHSQDLEPAYHDAAQFCWGTAEA